MRVGQQLEMYVHGCRYGYSVYAHRGVPADMGKSFKLTVMADNTSRGHGSECQTRGFTELPATDIFQSKLCRLHI